MRGTRSSGCELEPLLPSGSEPASEGGVFKFVPLAVVPEQTHEGATGRIDKEGVWGTISGCVCRQRVWVK